MLAPWQRICAVTKRQRAEDLRMADGVLGVGVRDVRRDPGGRDPRLGAAPGRDPASLDARLDDGCRDGDSRGRARPLHAREADQGQRVPDDLGRGGVLRIALAIMLTPALIRVRFRWRRGTRPGRLPITGAEPTGLSRPTPRPAAGRPRSSRPRRVSERDVAQQLHGQADDRPLARGRQARSALRRPGVRACSRRLRHATALDACPCGTRGNRPAVPRDTVRVSGAPLCLEGQHTGATRSRRGRFSGRAASRGRRSAS